MTTPTVTAPFPVPEAELSVSQLAVSLAVHVNVPPPVLLIFRVWLAGLVPPCVAVKERLVGLMPRAGDVGWGEEEDDGEISWASPGISAKSRLIPPGIPVVELDGWLAAAADTDAAPIRENFTGGKDEDEVTEDTAVEPVPLTGVMGWIGMIAIDPTVLLRGA